jgi:hypothetical protein
MNYFIRVFPSASGNIFCFGDQLLSRDKLTGQKSKATTLAFLDFACFDLNDGDNEE